MPMPRPATPMPATSGAIWNPNLSSATTKVKTITTTRTTRTMSLRAGGSGARFWSQLSARLPTQRATSKPTARITTAPSTWKPYRMARSNVTSLAERFMGASSDHRRRGGREASPRRRGGTGERNSGVLAQLETPDLAAMHFVWTIGEAPRARVRPPDRERELLADAAAAVELHGAVQHAQRHVRHRHLDLGDGLLGRLVAHGVHHVGGVEHQEPRLVDLDP